MHDAGYDAMLIFTTTDQQPKRSILSRWMKDDESIRYMVIIDDRVDDEDQTDLSWNRLIEKMKDIIHFLEETQKVTKNSPSKLLFI